MAGMVLSWAIAGRFVVFWGCEICLLFLGNIKCILVFLVQNQPMLSACPVSGRERLSFFARWAITALMLAPVEAPPTMNPRERLAETLGGFTAILTYVSEEKMEGFVGNWKAQAGNILISRYHIRHEAQEGSCIQGRDGSQYLRPRSWRVRIRTSNRIVDDYVSYSPAAMATTRHCWERLISPLTMEI